MKAIFAVPFRRAAVARVQGRQWVLLGDIPAQLPDALADWDYNTELAIARAVSVDVAGIRDDVGLQPDDRIALVAMWSSPGSFQRGLICRRELGSAAEYELAGQLSGRDASGSIRLETCVILVNDCTPRSVLSPAQAGSILWRDSVEVRVEGTSARFPVEVIDFSQAAWAATDAAWMLSWNRHDFHQPFMGAVRLFINSGHERVVKAVSGGLSDPEAAAVRSAIYVDVGRALIKGALAEEEFVLERNVYENGTVGRSIANLFGLLFPNESLEGLRGMAEQRPDYFESLLQARLRLFWY
jgi:hypothetical protein